MSGFVGWTACRPASSPAALSHSFEVILSRPAVMSIWPRQPPVSWMFEYAQNVPFVWLTAMLNRWPIGRFTGCLNVASPSWEMAMPPSFTTRMWFESAGLIHIPW